MAVLRQSLIAIGYVLILLPRVKDGSEVLNQSTQQQSQQSDRIDKAIKVLEKDIEVVENCHKNK
jgi:hypothetical protein